RGYGCAECNFKRTFQLTCVANPAVSSTSHNPSSLGVWRLGGPGSKVLFQRNP
ncbi:unnamed protein product, partial [Amoebophrya sp. A25]